MSRYASPPFTVLVSSTDSFADTWPPFFHLLEVYWRDLEAPIVLNSENRTFDDGRLDITHTLIGRFFPGRHPTWSESIGAALSLVETDYILYLQDDYFLNDHVRNNVLNELLSIMGGEGLPYIRLLDGSSTVRDHAHPWLEVIQKSTQYYLSLQASLWRTDHLTSLLRKHESPWEFELLGSRRARRRGATYARVSKELFHPPGKRIVPYEPTGIVKGRWKRGVVEALFAEHGIDLDFSVRGFHEGEGEPESRQRPYLERLIRRMRSW